MFDTLFEVDPPKTPEEIATENWVARHNAQFATEKRYKPVTPISALDPKQAEQDAIMLIRSTLYSASRRYGADSARKIAGAIDAEAMLKEGKLPAGLAARKSILIR